MNRCLALVPPDAFNKLEMKKTESARDEVEKIYEGAKAYCEQEAAQPASN